MHLDLHQFSLTSRYKCRSASWTKRTYRSFKSNLNLYLFILNHDLCRACGMSALKTSVYPMGFCVIVSIHEII